MEWSGRAPAPPVTNLARDSKDKGARHVSEPQGLMRRNKLRLYSITSSARESNDWSDRHFAWQ